MAWNMPASGRPAAGRAPLRTATWTLAGGTRVDAIAGILGGMSLCPTDVYVEVVDQIAKNMARCPEKSMGLNWARRAQNSGFAILMPLGHKRCQAKGPREAAPPATTTRPTRMADLKIARRPAAIWAPGTQSL